MKHHHLQVSKQGLPWPSASIRSLSAKANVRLQKVDSKAPSILNKIYSIYLKRIRRNIVLLLLIPSLTISKIY